MVEGNVVARGQLVEITMVRNDLDLDWQQATLITESKSLRQWPIFDTINTTRGLWWASA